jgi:hypothetical protein
VALSRSGQTIQPAHGNQDDFVLAPDLKNVVAALPDEFCVLKIAVGKQMNLVGGYLPVMQSGVTACLTVAQP